MQSDRKHKVLIVGAGPGGAAAAVALAQRGVRDVLLLDKDVFPRDKTCGSALSPNGLKLVEQFGIGADVKRLGYPIDGLRLVTPGGREMHFRTEQAAVVLLRKHFDNLLVDKARSLGVEFRGSFIARELVKEGDRAVGVRGRLGGASGEMVEYRADYVLCADGAHSIFSTDPRPKRTISCLMGWWENMPFEPGTMEMVFDKNISPLYGWLFPENTERVNIGICMDGEDAAGNKTERNVREVFARFLDDNFRDRLRGARQIGKLKGHPISYTTWVGHCTAPGALWLGEAARVTHNATGEGIYQAMQSGVYAAEAVAEVVHGRADEARAWRDYVWQHRRRFTAAFAGGHVLRAVLKTPLLDAISIAYNNASVRRFTTWALGSAMAGSTLSTSGSAGSAVVGAPAEAPRNALAVN